MTPGASVHGLSWLSTATAEHIFNSPSESLCSRDCPLRPSVVAPRCISLCDGGSQGLNSTTACTCVPALSTEDLRWRRVLT